MSVKLMAKLILSLLMPVLVVSLEKPEGISDEMYCMGCQAVLKELDMSLSRKPTRGVGETVSRALKQVCHENNFKKFEISYTTALKVCKHIKDDYGMEQILVSEYSRLHELGHKSSYLSITQKVCGSHFHACNDPEFLEHGKDGGIVYNTDTQTFNIKTGSKVKTAKPVTEEGLDIGNKKPTPENIKIMSPEFPTPDSHDEL